MKRPVLLSFVVLSLVCLSTAADARTYVRWCDARFRIVPFESVEPTLVAPRDNVYTETFRARASAGWYIPNTIRERAYRRARDCFNSLWDAPNSGSEHGVPAQCTNDGGNGIYGFNPSPSLLEDIRNRACHAWRAHRGTTVRVRIIGNVWGDDGCGGSYFDNDASLYPYEGSDLWWRPGVPGAAEDSYYPLPVPRECRPL